MAFNNRSIYTKNTCIGNIYAVGTYIGYIDIKNTCTGYSCARDVFAEGVEPSALARLRVILVDLGVNDCCFILFMKFIFVWKEIMICWGG